MSYSPFASTETYRRTLYRPGTPTEEIGWVELRPLSAGQLAKLQELRLIEGEGSIQVGRMKILQMVAAIVAWSFSEPVNEHTIAQLKPLVFEQIYEHVDAGGGESEEPDPTSSSSPEPESTNSVPPEPIALADVTSS